MIHRAAILFLVSAMMAAASGCGVCHSLYYHPFGPDSLYSTEHCSDQACGPDVAPVRERIAGCGCGRPWLHGYRRARADACDSCDEPCGEACARPCYGPLTWLFGLFRCGTFCGSGCGERYWGDWYGDPPDLCDPCDNYGNFTPDGSCSSCGAAKANEYEVAGRSRGSAAGCDQCRKGGQVARTRQAPQPAGRSSPRLISETDRAVEAAEAEETPHVAPQPRKAPTRR